GAPRRAGRVGALAVSTPGATRRLIRPSVSLRRHQGTGRSAGSGRAFPFAQETGRGSIRGSVSMAPAAPQEDRRLPARETAPRGERPGQKPEVFSQETPGGHSSLIRAPVDLVRLAQRRRRTAGRNCPWSDFARGSDSHRTLARRSEMRYRLTTPPCLGRILPRFS